MSSADPRAGGEVFFLSRTARRLPHAPAIVSVGEGGAPAVSTYAALERAAAAAASALLARGVRPGDRLALLLPPSPAYAVLLLALARAGIVAVPLSTRLPTGAVPGLLSGIGCRAALVSTTTGGAIPGVASIDADDLLATSPASDDPPAPHVDPTRDAAVVFTSGSSGRPKAALHTLASLLASAAGANENIPFGPGKRWLLSLPLWHVGGLGIIFRAFLGGGAVAIPSGQPLGEALEQLGATHVSLVATQLARLLREPRHAAVLAQLDAVLLGGGPAPPPLVAQAGRRGVRLATSYGSTELASQVTATRPGGPPALLLTSGRPLPGREIAISPGGEILARGATLFRGYLVAGGLDPARDEAGWFHTGDLGSLDADGSLRVTGRIDAMFVSGGENIHPEEIERELERHPAIEEALVVPVESEEYGQRPVAFLRCAGPAPGADELDAFLRRALPGFKIPERYLPWPPLAEGVKPLRSELSDLARDGRR